MAKSLYLEEDYKPKVHTPRTKSLSFFASIFSLFIYICVFYTFNLSPYSLLNNNIFWFFMSNTLILIIAADYGAFSSSRKKEDLYEEYVQHNQARNYATPYVPKYDGQVHKQCINPKQELGCKLLEEKKKTTSDQNIPERVLEIVVLNQPKKPSECSNEKRPELHVHDGNEKIEEKAIPARIYRRSKSDRSNRQKHVMNEERVCMVQRSETVKVIAVQEENEFSKMSNEDLNRRIEEFIHKIKSQATRKVYQI
ncbi:unnamed protein product [Sphenostylis stenocarpa]|uniref:Uncharacterized protein n=1 Tax=Sphenostylis stenocarpa TaxID=92480 RepID=A0AA86T0I9_9FABA|nr:unnamed protein product [Sphenostylis stenocarpa]